jgi:hypothetical protein
MTSSHEPSMHEEHALLKEAWDFSTYSISRRAHGRGDSLSI